LLHTLEQHLSTEFLQREIIALREQNHILLKQNLEQERVILELRANLTTLQNLLFGKSSEQTQNKSAIFGDGKGSGTASGKGDGSKEKKGGHRQRRNHKKLPLVETTVDLPEDTKKCPCCSLDFEYVNDIEEGETVEIEVKGYTSI
jgi:hypothetical protein